MIRGAQSKRSPIVNCKRLILRQFFDMQMILPRVKEERNLHTEVNENVYVYMKDCILAEYLVLQDVEYLQNFSELINV